MIKLSVDKKVIWFVHITIFVMAIGILAVDFVSIWSLRFKTIGERQRQDAEIFSTLITRQIASEIKAARKLVTHPILQDAVKEANLSYENLEPKAIQDHMAKMDKEWTHADPDTPIVKERLSSLLGRRLRALKAADTNIAEIFLTDKYGGLIASSDKTSDFFQADESWWEYAYNNGKGDVFFGDLELDESSNIISSALAVPIEDNAGHAAGVVKVVLDIGTFFQPLREYKFGNTGHVDLVDEKTTEMIFAPSLHPEGDHFFKESLAQLLKSKDGYGFLKGSRSGEQRLVSAVRIQSPLFKDNAVKWIVVVSQARDEIFEPLYQNSIKGLLLVLLLLLMTGLILQNALRKMFIFPIKTLQAGADRFSKGDLDYQIYMKTGDEFEQLAGALNTMTTNLKNSMVSRDGLMLEVEQRKSAEKMLEAAQGTLREKNKLLDLQLNETEKNREILVSMLEDNNAVREELENKLEELRQAHAILAHAEKMETIGKMAAGVAHEVKNPLGIVLQGINYFEGTLSSGEKEAQEMLQLMKTSVRRADSIVRALLDFSRVGNLVSMSLNINDIIEKSITLVQYEIKNKSVSVMKDLGNIPILTLDGQKIEQVFINVLSNAIYAMPKGGNLSIRSYVANLNTIKDKVGYNASGNFVFDGNAVIVEVEDTGEGMDEETRKKVFEPFFTTKNRTDGLGLGLSVSKSIMEMHRGLIYMDSKKGLGTKVTMLFKIPGGV